MRFSNTRNSSTNCVPVFKRFGDLLETFEKVPDAFVGVNDVVEIDFEVGFAGGGEEVLFDVLEVANTCMA